MAVDWREVAGDVRIMMSKANLSRHFSSRLHTGAFSYDQRVPVSYADETLQREFTAGDHAATVEYNESRFYELVMEFHQLASSAVADIPNSLIITLVSGICGKSIFS